MSESCEILQKRGGWWEDVLSKHCTFPIGSINTFTNIAYAIAGIVVCTLLPVPPSFVMGFFLSVLAVGSGLYHGFKTIWASRLDHVGMYSVFGALTIYTISPTHRFIWALMALGGIAVATSLSYAPTWKYLLNPILGVFIAISTMAAALRGNLSFAVVSFGIFLMAYMIWWMDKKRWFWFPKWGHGIWHVLTAIAVTLLYLGVK